MHFLRCLIPLGAVLVASALGAAETHDVSITDPRILLAPYVWKSTGAGLDARAEAAMPGAYLKIAVEGTEQVALLIDGSANGSTLPLGS